MAIGALQLTLYKIAYFICYLLNLIPRLIISLTLLAILMLWASLVVCIPFSIGYFGILTIIAATQSVFFPLYLIITLSSSFVWLVYYLVCKLAHIREEPSIDVADAILDSIPFVMKKGWFIPRKILFMCALSTYLKDLLRKKYWSLSSQELRDKLQTMKIASLKNQTRDDLTLAFKRLDMSCTQKAVIVALLVQIKQAAPASEPTLQSLFIEALKEELIFKKEKFTYHFIPTLLNDLKKIKESEPTMPILQFHEFFIMLFYLKQFVEKNRYVNSIFSYDNLRYCILWLSKNNLLKNYYQNCTTLLIFSSQNDKQKYQLNPFMYLFLYDTMLCIDEIRGCARYSSSYFISYIKNENEKSFFKNRLKNDLAFLSTATIQEYFYFILKEHEKTANEHMEMGELGYYPDFQHERCKFPIFSSDKKSLSNDRGKFHIFSLDKKSLSKESAIKSNRTNNNNTSLPPTLVKVIRELNIQKDKLIEAHYNINDRKERFIELYCKMSMGKNNMPTVIIKMISNYVDNHFLSSMWIIFPKISLTKEHVNSIYLIRQDNENPSDPDFLENDTCIISSLKPK